MNPWQHSHAPLGQWDVSEFPPSLPSSPLTSLTITKSRNRVAHSGVPTDLDKLVVQRPLCPSLFNFVFTYWPLVYDQWTPSWDKAKFWLLIVWSSTGPLAMHWGYKCNFIVEGYLDDQVKQKRLMILLLRKRLGFNMNEFIRKTWGTDR